MSTAHLGRRSRQHRDTWRAICFAPVHVRTHCDAAPSASAIPACRNVVSGVASLRILVVEDDADSLDLMAELLRSTGDHTIALASSGEEGLELLRLDAAYDLIVTDIVLPGVSGLEMLQHASQDGHTAGATIVVCSADTDLEPEALAIGARWIPKPVHPNEIVDLVRACGTHAND
jgi:two-component system cell cycle response regulator CpdR